MRNFVSARQLVQQFRDYLKNPNIQANDVHALLAKYGVPKRQGKYSIVYNYDEVVDALGTMYYHQMEQQKQEQKRKNREQYPQEDYSSPEENMDYVSQELLKQDDVMNETKKRKKIFLTEEQMEFINESISKEKVIVDPNKVLIVKKFLDNNFQRGGISSISEDGYPTTIKIVAMKGTDGNPIRNMNAEQLFYLLQDKFKNIYADTNKRDILLKQIIKDWYKDKISKHGMLTVNMI
jgi:hypothetical protein